jgi:hypothetical protein
LAFVAKRRHTQRGTPQRFPLVATAKPCTAMVPMSPPLRLGKVTVLKVLSQLIARLLYTCL